MIEDPEGQEAPRSDETAPGMAEDPRDARIRLLEGRIEALEASLAALDPREVARLALRLLRTDPLVQAQDFNLRMGLARHGHGA